MKKGLKEHLAEETGERMRRLTGLPARITMILAAVFSLFYIYTSGFGLISTEIHRGAYLLFTMLLCFMLYPPRKGKAGDTVPVFDWILCLFAAPPLNFPARLFAKSIRKVPAPVASRKAEKTINRKT